MVVVAAAVGVGVVVVVVVVVVIVIYCYYSKPTHLQFQQFWAMLCAVHCSWTDLCLSYSGIHCHLLRTYDWTLQAYIKVSPITLSEGM